MKKFLAFERSDYTTVYIDYYSITTFYYDQDMRTTYVHIGNGTDYMSFSGNQTGVLFDAMKELENGET